MLECADCWNQSGETFKTFVPGVFSWFNQPNKKTFPPFYLDPKLWKGRSHLRLDDSQWNRDERTRALEPYLCKNRVVRLYKKIVWWMKPIMLDTMPPMQIYCMWKGLHVLKLDRERFQSGLFANYQRLVRASFINPPTPLELTGANMEWLRVLPSHVKVRGTHCKSQLGVIRAHQK